MPADLAVLLGVVVAAVFLWILFTSPGLRLFITKALFLVGVVFVILPFVTFIPILAVFWWPLALLCFVPTIWRLVFGREKTPEAPDTA